MPNTPLIFRINAAAASLGLSRATIYRLAQRGELKLVKLSPNTSGILADSLHAYLARCTQATKEA